MRFLQIKRFSLKLLSSYEIPVLIVRNSSKYKRSAFSVLPRDNLFAQFKQKAYEDESQLCPAEWNKLRERMLAMSKNVQLHNIDALILGQCQDPEDFTIAKSYLQFLQAQGIEPNNATLGKLLKIYYLSGKNSKLSQLDELEILKICNKIRAEREAFDSTTCENLIHGLLATAYWKDSLDILKMAKLTSSPSVTVYSSMISKAFMSNEIELGWQLLEEMIEAGKQPKCEVYISYIQYSSKEQRNFVENIEKLFKLLEKHELLISQAVMENLKSCLEAQGKDVSLTTLNDNGTCQNCRCCMRNISITDEEFNTLSSSFLDRVLIRKDVFQKSTPIEVEKFVKHVEKTGPYDCVIDGLNVAYSCGARKHPKVFVNLLSSVIKYFKRQNKHVLVLGRKHMNTWPKEGMNYVKRNSSVFFTNDLTHDDPFLLYATLKSGPTTDFFSRDLMRSHAFLLGGELKSVFKRWQQEHQYSLLSVSDVGIVVKEPTRHFKYAQEVNNTWHLPYTEDYSANPAEVLDVPKKWMCIKMNKEIDL